MRRPLSRVRLYLLCAVFAQGFGTLCAVQSVSQRLSDAAGSTSDGFRTPTSSQFSTLLCGVLDEKQTAVTATFPHLKTESVHNVPRRHIPRRGLSHVICLQIVNEPRPPLKSATSGREDETGQSFLLRRTERGSPRASAMSQVSIVF